MISTERMSDKRCLLLNSCGIEHIYGKRHGALREKGRVDYHLLYIAEGVCHVKFDGEACAVVAGNVIVFLPNAPQEYYFDGEKPAVSYYIHFTGRDCHRLLSELGLNKTGVYATGKSLEFEKVFDTMLLEYSLKKADYELLCEALLQQLLVILSRRIQLSSDGLDSEQVRQIHEAMEYMYRNMGNELSLEEIAKGCFRSVGYFSHLFKDIAGVPPHRYVTSLRIERAMELLSDTELTVAEIGRAVGFADQNYFSRAFKAHTGVSPLAYRKSQG